MRGLAIRSTAVGGEVTTTRYDALGRLTAVWTPGYQTTGTPAYAYDYAVPATGPKAVTTRTAVTNAAGIMGQTTSVAIFSSTGQALQTQADAPGGGRTITESFYDSMGRTIRSNNHWYTVGTPSATLIHAADTAIDSRTVTYYDGAGRTTLTIDYAGVTETRRTQMVYSGLTTLTIPPIGASPTSVTLDAYGRTVTHREYDTPPTITGTTITGGTYRVTSYGYDAKAQIVSVTDPATTQSTRTYDLAGRMTSTSDPDVGTTTTTYNDAGDVTTTTDARPSGAGKLSYTYDAVGRKTEMRVGPSNILAARWTYDTVRAGLLTSTEVFKNGDIANPYVQKVKSVDDAGRPLQTQTIIPDTELVLKGVYTTDVTYTPTGQPKTVTIPAIGSALPSEKITYGYTDQGLPRTMAGTNSYVTGATYNPFGQLTQYVGKEGNGIVLNLTHNTESLLTTESLMTAAAVVSTVDRTTITYDPAGKITKTYSVRPVTTSNVPTRTVCDSYDGYQRLVATWTATDNCASTPTTTDSSMVGGDVPMWLTWGFTLDGRRTSQIRYQTPGSATTTATSGYSYNGAGLRHTLGATTTTGGASPSTVSYLYDEAGNTTTRTTTPSVGTATTDTFTYAETGRVSTVSNDRGTSKYLYDADGNVLIREDPVSGKTLYLSGTEVRLPVGAGALQATRYYSFSGMTIAQRDSVTGLKALYNDPQGTSLIAISWTNLATRTRRTNDPYGNEVGLRNGPWPNPRAFGNQPLNTHTQLVDMGARLYDRDQGRFLQSDPIVNPGTPDSMNGYTYAAGDPVNGNDFSGLMRDGGSSSNAGIAPSGGEPSSGGTTTPPAEPTDGPGRAVKVVVKKASQLGSLLSLLTPWGQMQAGASVVDSAIDAWGAGSDYIMSIPNKTPGELWADYNAFEGGKVVGALSILGDLGQQAASPIDDLKYIFLNTPQPPSSSELLGSVAAWAGIKTDSTPYKAGVITGQIEGTIALTALTGGTAGAGGAARAGSVGGKAAASGSLAEGGAWLDDAVVLVRGGTNTVDRFVSGSGVITKADGTLSGVSVNSGRSVSEAARGIPNNQIGVSTVGEVRAAGGTVTPLPTKANPGHCQISGCTAQQLSDLFTPTIRNPSSKG